MEQFIDVVICTDTVGRLEADRLLFIIGKRDMEKMIYFLYCIFMRLKPQAKTSNRIRRSQLSSCTSNKYSKRLWTFMIMIILMQSSN